MTEPAMVCVHGLAQAREALAAAARLGIPITLVSAPGAALYAGCGWWRQVMTAAGSTDDLLDCADAAGAAMAALRVGQLGLILDAATPALAAVQGAAQVLGARVLTTRPAALDLGAPDGTWRLAAWIGRGPG